MLVVVVAAERVFSFWIWIDFNYQYAIYYIMHLNINIFLQ